MRAADMTAEEKKAYAELLQAPGDCAVEVLELRRRVARQETIIDLQGQQIERLCTDVERALFPIGGAS